MFLSKEDSLEMGYILAMPGWDVLMKCLAERIGVREREAYSIMVVDVESAIRLARKQEALKELRNFEDYVKGLIESARSEEASPSEERVNPT